MEGKWIVDTNKRYKIFEDGDVVSYVNSKNPIVLKPNKDKRVFLTFKYGEIKKSISVSKLLNIYFPKESEDWKWVQDYEARYKIYKNGDIESCYKNSKTKILKPTKNKKTGYFNINLCKKGQRKSFLIHRLIGIHFIPNPENKEMIDHIDGNIVNNSISNLRWVSQQENCLNAKNYGKHKKGVTFNKNSQKFQTRITVNGKEKHLGYYETEDEAHEVYKAKFLEIHGIEVCSR
tara:strand:+ start:26 stop:724 length:699 start_codon:yes stop_codon:yes gene_type:complete